jgi:hypothetical protein
LTKKIVIGFVLAFAALISMAAISSAQPPGFPDRYPYPDDWLNPWSEQNNWPGQWPDNWPNQWEDPYPTTEHVPESSGMFSDSAHPTGGPGGSQPLSTPSASTSSPISTFDDGELLSESDVKRLPDWSSLLAPGGGWDGSPTSSGSPDALSDYYGGSLDYYGSYYSGTQDRYGRYYGGTKAYYRGYYGGYYGGLQHWIYYCGRWTYGPAAMRYGQQTNTITRNNQYQHVWYYDKYPSGYQQWEYGGYRYPGYYFGYFGADQRGWHQIAVWGSRSGWSNPIWVYVW